MATITTRDSPVWLASYPRSGNMFLRLLLWHVFGLKSDSMYPKDIESEFQEPGARFIKTHGNPTCPSKAIYVVRDGREVCVSYFHYLHDGDGKQARPDLTLRDVIRGDVWFDKWSDHLRAWHPLSRPDTLLLRYEDMLHRTCAVVGQLAVWLGISPTGKTMPTFATLHAALPFFFRSGTNETWRDEMTGDDLSLFWELHGAAMGEYGYE